MKMEERMIKKYNHISYIDFVEDTIVWNRFFPSVLKFKKDTFECVLKAIDDYDFRSKLAEESLNNLKKNNILSDEDYAKKFFSLIELHIEERRNKLMLNIQDKKPFSTVQLFFEKCNLYCPYCIMAHTWGRKEHRTTKKKTSQKNPVKNISEILEKQYQAMEIYPIDLFSITISGGEPLLKFDLLKEVINYVRKVRNDKKTIIDMNTNASLLTEEIIEFLIEKNIKLHISIDGNQAHHNTTRVYYNGKGSFDDVMNGILLLKKMGYPEENLEKFQGTLYNFDLLDKEEIFNFSEMGFKVALLYPNLIGVSMETGRKNASGFFELYKESLKRNLTLSSAEINKLSNVLDEGINPIYRPYCNGLGANTKELLLQYNIPNESLSYLCQFIPGVSKKHGKSINIFDMELFNKSIEYQYKRLESMKKHCIDCSVIGICNGGCIMNGLNAFNEKNEGACSFWETIWCSYLNEYVKEEV
jgi:radical SAM protein with 4Fe4S-binding SPASM domain